MTARVRGAASTAAILDRLRAQTRAAHDAVERELRWEHRVGSLEGYRGLLARLYGFHAAWEPAAAPLVADEAFFGPRRKVPLLLADLAWLGLQPADIGGLPLCVPAVPMATRADALGAMYVLEGSTLGGQLIARRVSSTLGLAPGAGCSYYGAYGEATGAMWRGFCARLAAASSPEADDAMVRAAQETFGRLRGWLTAPAAATSDQADPSSAPLRAGTTR